MDPAARNLTPCVTPWTAEDALDESALRRQLRFLAKHGMGVCLGAYSTGEGLLLEPAEKRRLYEIGVEELRGRVPAVAASLGYTSTAVVIRNAREAQAIGVDAVQIYPPRPGPEAARLPLKTLEVFYREVCEAVTAPLFLGVQLDNMPDKTFPIELLGRLLSDYSHIRGINCTTRDEGEQLRLTNAFAARVPVRCGGSLNIIGPHLEAGGAGYLGLEGCVAPDWLNGFTEALRHGRRAAAAELFEKLKALGAVLRVEPISGVKAALGMLGLIEPHVRRPYLPLDSAEAASLRERLAEIGLLPPAGERTSAALA